MKNVIFVLGAIICATLVSSRTSRLLGAKECTWGPSYWCSNITNAKSCHAISHCIQTVWEHQKLPADNDSVCQICVKMVTEARAQLESNETQEELREVFDGSCKLIPLRTISNECCKLADEFIPELVETLASQMNPQVVCSVAGLCNNARIDKLLEEEEQKPSSNVPAVRMSDCDGCRSVVTKIQENFNALSKDEVLQGMLRVCGKMGSFSDSCTNIIITYFSDIYSHLNDNLNPEEVCLMAGVCFAQFHTHAEVTPLANSGIIDVATKDDLPCDLCEQLVKHLRDLLVANTTEAEFQRVLDGLCSQTKNFKDECRSIVDEYYPQIYHFLVSELDSKVVCVMAGICKGTKEDVPIWPLLPVETVSKSVTILNPSKDRLVGQDEKHSYKRPKDTHIIFEKDALLPPLTAESGQLPIERMFPQTLTMVGNPQLCTFCEYFLHFLQQEVTQPKTVEKIKEIVDHACERLPRSITKECDEFVQTYGDAFVALLVQEIDPSQLCPLLSLCPSAGLHEVEIFMHSKPTDKPNCPLCLFAVTQLEEMVKKSKTEQKIKAALETLCTHLPKNLGSECEDFVNTYSKELIEMLIADLSPQEVCVYLKLCDDKTPKLYHPLVHTAKNEIGGVFTNEIPDDTVEGKYLAGQTHQKVKDETLITAEVIKVIDRNPQCVICEFIMSRLEDELKNKKTEDEIKHVVHGICNYLPKTVARDCNNFVNQYADIVIQLLINAAEPSEVCSMLSLCKEKMIRMSEEVTECAICGSLVSSLSKLMDNPNIDHKIEHVLKKACLALPDRYHQKCDTMIDVYGDSFFELVSEITDANVICTKVGLCHNPNRRMIRSTPLGSSKCTYGPSYWCKSTSAATECNAHAYCNEKVWQGNPPQ